MEDLEIFVITNGRKTFEFTMKSLENQTQKRKITVIRDMKWVNALNKCIDLCESEFFLRIDDDMAIHQFAIAYYINRTIRVRKSKTGVYVCKLWEDWSNKPAGGLRMYRHDITSKIRFRPSKLGKVDKVFRDDLQRRRWKQTKDKSILGLHMLGSIEDQQKYRKLWRDKNASISRKAFGDTFDNKIHPVDQSLTKQFRVLKKIRRLNKKYDTKFLRFMLSQRQENA
ncbi:hypothetical protein LCGC14_1046200 [marine sediment metagenome]|uniref:Glycosyltransferase 2-like domain-containing protein n=1 Tax=marine sediment metagenome TaxID=412755 RepID=A0A0F9MUN3_9ZZZZ